MKKFNFYSGPAILPEEVLRKSSESVIELDNIGLSLIEISHRSKEFEGVLDKAKSLIKELLELSSEFEILFLQGGASTQFCMIPFNFLNQNESAGYLDIGTWSSKAIKEASYFGSPKVVGSSKDTSYRSIPKNFSIESDLKYLHITSNETIQGIQMKEFPDTNVPLIADMSSDIFSRKLDFNKFDLIYAGAQKNMGPSGVTLVLIKKSMLNRINKKIPTMLDYRVHVNDGSLHNTPCTFGIYVSMLTMQWLKDKGGISQIETYNRTKAQKLYDEIDKNGMFSGVAEVVDRSDMNVVWVMKDPTLEKEFGILAKEAGCIGIEGHRSVGGFRASIYNAMPLEGIDCLIEVMKDFERKKG